MKLNRHKIREIAFQTLFAMHANPSVDRKQLMITLSKTENLPTYLIQLVNGVLNHQEDIDEDIKKRLPNNWPINRISETNLIILKIGFFEIYYISNDSVPNRVAINEAIELTKKYSDDNSKNFVNGILPNLD